MSAFRVCKGTRPSIPWSLRDISDPPRRPDTLILVPWAPLCMARWIDCLIARRWEIRRSSWSATERATRAASVSGMRISLMFTRILRALAAAADDDAGAGRVYADGDQVGVSLNLDGGDAGVRQQPGDRAADRQVLLQEVRIVTPGEPLAVPVVDIAKAEAVRVHLLSHATAPLPRR